MPRLIIGLFFGVVAGYMLPGLPDIYQVLPWAAAFSGVLAIMLSNPRLRRAGYCLLALGIGLTYSLWNADQRMQERLSPDCEGKEFQVTGRVSTVPNISFDRQRFEFEINEAQSAHACFSALPVKVLLSWYGSQDTPVRLGEHWQLTVRLKRPHGLHNPGLFDYERYLFTRSVAAAGYVRQSPDNRLEDNQPAVSISRLRQFLVSRIEQAAADRPGRGILQALTLGDRSRIDWEQREALRRTGTTHLVAISGLHVGLIAGWIFFLVRWLWSLTGSLARRVAPVDAAALCASAGALSYALLAGFSLPTQRALVMLLLMMVALRLRRQTRLETILLSALGIVLLFDPLAPVGAGFWFSFMAVSIIAVAIRRHRTRPRWQQFFLIQAYISIGLMPLQLYLFESTSLTSPLVNLIAIPLFSFLLVPATVIAVGVSMLHQQAGAFLIQAVLWMIEQFLSAIDLTAALPGTQLEIPGFSLLQAGLLAVVVGSPLVLGWRFSIPTGITGLLLIVLLGRFDQSPPPHGTFDLTFLDVGQGLAVLVETENHLLVYDTGPRYGAGTDAAKRVVIPYLEKHGTDHIDRLIISHKDSDHSGGGASLLTAFPVGQLWVGERVKRLKSVQQLPCHEGKEWSWDGVRFRFLYPFQSWQGSGNDASCVLQIGEGNHRVLLTGDIGRRVENKLVTHYGQTLKSTILAVPHHGSSGSSGQRFVQTVAADYAVVSAGYRNRFGFPTNAVQSRYADAGTALFTTARSGAVMFRVTPEGITKPKLSRITNRRIWTERFLHCKWSLSRYICSRYRFQR